MNKRHLILWALGGSLVFSGVASAVSGGADDKNLYASYPQVSNLTSGVAWPQGQALPVFATPAARLDTILVQSLTSDEQITFSALQGIVNRTQPRVYLLDSSADEGTYTWANTSTVDFESRNLYTDENKYDLIAKYADEIDGVVLYDIEKSPHYRNLASTVGNVRNALPVTAEVYENLRERGIDLDVAVDLTGLDYTTAIEIYTHLYQHYWDECDRRLLISARPSAGGGSPGDFHHTRDIAAATGVAVVWLNTLDPDEKKVLQRFLGDMEAGAAMVLGWYTTERSGITTVSQYGIGTIPADHYISGTVYGGTDHTIQIQPVPNKPALEEKVYIALFISDGDNIQYVQRAMREVWDRTAASRGEVPLNWTIAPGLVDIGPALLNYYYMSATPKDYFVTGPSGMGYMMPFNTLTEEGAPVGNYLTDPERMAGYAQLTETYLQRSGLRVMTIWDQATPMQRAMYEKYGRNLYGATVQNFRDVPSVSGSVEDGRVRFDKLEIPYGAGYDHVHGAMAERIDEWDGDEPLFLSYQVDVWSEMSPDRIVDLRDELREEFGDKFQFVRADHYFNLYNEAHGLPFNLSMSAETTVSASGSKGTADFVLDGTPLTLWSASQSDQPSLTFDLGDTYALSRYVIRHAGEHGLSEGLNTRAYRVQASDDGSSWETIDTFTDNYANVTDVEFEPVRARYVKIVIDDAGDDSTARIAEVEIYGSR